MKQIIESKSYFNGSVFKVTLVLLVFIGQLFSSCSTKDQEPVEILPPASMFISDFLASAEAAELLLAAGLEIYCPACFAAAVTIAGISGSAATMSINPNHIMPSEQSLPVEFQLPSNPFESIGAMHNKGLGYIVRQWDYKDYTNLMNETNFHELAELIGEEAYKTKKSIMTTSTFRENKEFLRSYEALRKGFDYKKYFKNNIGLENTNLKAETKFYISVLNKKIGDLKLQKEKYLLINSEIKKLLENNSNNNNTSKIIYLTVYKYSYYAWSNK